MGRSHGAVRALVLKRILAERQAQDCTTGDNFAGGSVSEAAQAFEIEHCDHPIIDLDQAGLFENVQRLADPLAGGADDIADFILRQFDLAFGARMRSTMRADAAVQRLWRLKAAVKRRSETSRTC